MAVQGSGIAQGSVAAVVSTHHATQPNIQNHLHDIQGNILAGFNKDYQSLLFLQFTDAPKAKKWLASLTCEIATCSEVLSFNRLFKNMVKRRGGELGILKVTWTNIAFSWSGLDFLGVPGGVDSFPEAFKQGMAARASIIGDVGDSDPNKWISNFGTDTIHAVLIVAGDSPDDMRAQVNRYLQNLTASGGVELVFLQEGAVRQDQPGHEHFGFKDGVSQPGIRGITASTGSDPDQGDPGQDLLWPGEFVLGYPTQIPTPETPGDTDLNTKPGPISQSGPDWTANGSYLVFRRLRQDVEGFHKAMAAEAARLGLSEDLLGAKLVGRFASGCPLERTKDAPVSLDPNNGDPSLTDPTLLDDSRINNFEYVSDDDLARDDTDGHLVPRAGHIRKAYPRNQQFPGESETQTHRLLRRGIPFGTSFRPSLGATSHAVDNLMYPNDRGLLFLCYQTDLERQFEFVQKNWVNNANFPCSLAGTSGPLVCPMDAPDGEDPIISQAADPRSFRLPMPDGRIETLTLKQWVTMTGGEYFFSPSIYALDLIAEGKG